ncbi:CoA ester lyase [Pyxidicoccus fallax]|uniref:CoA ester lyase n=1 Tax=Pyxidicoccus fallax TaxID=394095 RepID=A0A848LCK7_9BACT|nr:aldolase/citrate lyase family protein [Pyxidicoccus fallax]NMO16216.1 CoA ester lyase [Pyxidicoccus fallax]NPC77701.1 CoA ester lyase [Pyxidicoccus fallax]
MVTFTPGRTVLVTPALDPCRFDKAEVVGADMGQLDLEDGVPPALKGEARRLAIDYLRHAPRRCPMSVRINSLRTADGLRDVLAMLDSGAGPDVIVIPKVESPIEVRQLDELLGGRFPELALMAIIETPKGVSAVDDIAAATPRLRGLIFGAADLSSQLGVPLTWEPMLYARSRIAMAAIGAGLHAIDSPFFDLQNPAGLEEETRRARALGFTGKIVIHPEQVRVVHDALRPSAQMVDQARRVLAQADDGKGGIHVVSGNMIGPPLVAAARRVLASIEIEQALIPIPLRTGSGSGDT